MQRVATYMAVKPGMEERYVAEHRNIWPEVLAGITRFGIRNYSIFMHGRELYSYFEVDDLEKTMAMAAADPDNQRWQVHMADFFDVGPGVQDGNTIYPVEIFFALGDELARPPLQRVAMLHMVKKGQEGALRLAAGGASPEVNEAIRVAGIRTDCIYLIGHAIFAYFQAHDAHHSSARLAADPAYQAWHSRLAGYIDAASGIRLEEVFYVE